jgi:hypothetical protein
MKKKATRKTPPKAKPKSSARGKHVKKPKPKSTKPKPQHVDNGRNEKGQFVAGNAEGHRFEEGHKDSEKWTPETVIPVMEKMLKHLTTDPMAEDEGDSKPINVVRANDIKLAGEIRLMFGVTKQRWAEWMQKFKDHAVISDLSAQIMEILECRLMYSGTSMDTFILKNHYDYTDKIDTTSKGKEVGTASSFLDLLKAASQQPSQ